MPRTLTALVLLAALITGCSKHATEPPPAGQSGPVPALVATQPPARSTGALYDGEIWAQFDRPLDGRTVTAQTVFLKLDGQRIPDTVRYDGITRRVYLKPGRVLELQRTYTVDFSTAVRGFDGTPLPPGVYFQFTTNSLRRIIYDFPAQNALEGPVACLGWGGPTFGDGNLFYELYASVDSLAVARRAVPFLQRSVFQRLLPTVAWPLGQRVFWAVTSENQTTRERMDGEVHAFQTFDETAPMDSVVIPVLDTGSNDARSVNTQFCSNVLMPSGPQFNAALHWNYSPITPDMRLASATLQLYFTDGSAGSFNAAQPSVWTAQTDWFPCSIRAPGPPWSEGTGLLANAISVDPVRCDFTAPRFAALIEAQYRGRTLVYGTLIRTLSNVNFHSARTTDGSRVPRVVARFYRLPPPAAPRAAAPASGATPAVAKQL